MKHKKMRRFRSIEAILLQAKLDTARFRLLKPRLRLAKLFAFVIHVEHWQIGTSGERINKTKREIYHRDV